MTPDEVRRTIESAFGRLRVPADSTLFYRGYENEEVDPAEDLTELVDLRWQEVDDAYILSVRSSMFHWLRPRAFRYYLPALLIAAINSVDSPESALFGVTDELRPCFRELYFKGFDRRLRSRQNAMSDAQYRAVSAFLGMVFERHPNARHYAAPAIHWGWSRFKTQELAAVENYYSSLRNYRYPDEQNAEIACVRREIEIGFADTPYPGDRNIVYGEGLVDPDVAMVGLEFRGAAWQTVHPELLARNSIALSCLSEAGFRYFLPAFLRSDLYDYPSNGNPVFHLTQGFDPVPFAEVLSNVSPYLAHLSEEYLGLIRTHVEQTKHIDWRSRTVARCASFTLPERRAIVSYLAYKANDEFSSDAINAALESYWRPSLGGQKVLMS